MNEDGDKKERIDVIDADVEYTEFLDKYLRPLKPCIIRGLTADWLAAREWTTLDPDTGALIPNFSALRETFGQHTGCITFCAETDDNGDAIQRELSVSASLDDFHRNYLVNKTRKQYLKDFHFMHVIASIGQPYSVPKFFQGFSL